MSLNTIRAALVLGALSLVLPAAGQSVVSVSVSPTSVQGGSSTSATVTLSGPAGVGGALVQLTSLTSALAMGPDTVLVPTGRTSATFPVTVLPVDTTFTGTLAAQSREGATQTTTLTVLSGAPDRTRIAVFRGSLQAWLIRQDGGATAPVVFGGPSDIPVPADYLGYGQAGIGTGETQIATFRPGTGEWFISSQTGTIQVNFGRIGDRPAAADYFRNGRSQLAVFRPETGEFLIRTDSGLPTTVKFGESGDIPVPADYVGLGRAQIATYRPSSQEWFIRKDGGDFEKIKFGEEADQPLPGDYFGVGRAQIAVFRARTSQFLIRKDDGDSLTFPFENPGLVGVPGDYLGLGRIQMAVYRPLTGEWFIRGDSGSNIRLVYGGSGDNAVPSAYSSRVAPVGGPAQATPVGGP